MSKIKVTHFTGVAPYLYVIDDKGRFWRSAVASATWVHYGEIPEAPKDDQAEFNVRRA